MKLQNFDIVKPIAGLSKQYTILVGDGKQNKPLVFLQKPKWIPASQWEKICASISVNLPINYEIKDKK
jgi:hypothetical protein